MKNLEAKYLYGLGVLFLLANLLTQNGIYPYTKNRWLFVLGATGLALPYVKLIWSIGKRARGLGLFSCMEQGLGRAASNVLAIVYFFYSLLMAGGYLGLYSRLIRLVTLDDMPLFFIMILFAITAGMLVFCGLEPLLGWARYVLPFLLFGIGIGFLCTVLQGNWDYILPVMLEEKHNFFKNTGMSFLSVFGQLSLFLLPLCSCSIKNEAKNVLVKVCILGGGVLSLVSAQNILLLGEQKAKTISYTSVVAFSTIHLSPLIQRLEVFMLLLLILCGLAYLGVHLWVEGWCIRHFCPKISWKKAVVCSLFSLVFMAETFFLWGETGGANFQKSGLFFAIFHIFLPAFLWLLFWRKQKSIDKMAMESYTKQE